MKMTLIVPNDNICHFKTALNAGDGRHLNNPTVLDNGRIMVSVQFPEDGKGYYNFWEVYDRLTAKIVEVDNRKWHTKFMNRIRLLFKRNL